jgi:signal peptidase I
MQPTFNPNLHKDPLTRDTVLVNKWASRVHRGDVVLLW